MIAATILAAGASSRMGFPKALLSFHGMTFLQSILDATEALAVQRYVVVGPESDKILSRHDLRDVTVLHNTEMETGPIGSIRASVQAVLHHPVDGLVVWPVDFPHVAVETVGKLIDRFRAVDTAVVVPVLDGRRGHPVLFGRAVFQELLAPSGNEGANVVVRADPTRVTEVLVEDRAVLDSLNTPEAYQDLLRREDQFRF
jgi:CTP:molybdopterin cytidylyltransferase MocA